MQNTCALEGNDALVAEHATLLKPYLVAQQPFLSSSLLFPSLPAACLSYLAQAHASHTPSPSPNFSTSQLLNFPPPPVARTASNHCHLSSLFFPFYRPCTFARLLFLSPAPFHLLSLCQSLSLEAATGRSTTPNRKPTIAQVLPRCRPGQSQSRAQTGSSREETSSEDIGHPSLRSLHGFPRTGNPGPNLRSAYTTSPKMSPRP